jgi:hypothetical protein
MVPVRWVGVIGHGRSCAEAAGCTAPLRSSRRVADAVAHQAAKIAHLSRRAEHRHDAGTDRRKEVLSGWAASLACRFVVCSRHNREIGSPAGASTARPRPRPVGVPVAQHAAAAALGVLFCMSVAAWRAVRIEWLCCEVFG